MKDPQIKLIQAALNLLEAGIDPEELTTRQIAAEAGMAHGLINYHFGSKEKLLNQAVSQMMQEEIGRVEKSDYQVSSLRERILTILMTNTQLGMRYKSLMRYTIKQDIQSAGERTIKTLMPLLRDHLGRAKKEEEMLLMAAQIVQPMELFFLNPQMLQEHMGWEMEENPKQLMTFFETLLNNLNIR